jgi:DNA-binding Lrp family transcriptional regulator
VLIWDLYMSQGLSEIEKKVVGAIQGGMPFSATPYLDMAEEAGVDVDEFLGVLRRFKAEGKIRRVGAIVSHVKVGLGAAAMVVWQVESERTEEVGQVFASFEEVSHAYQRPVSQEWQFNLYTMVHGGSDREVDATIGRLSAAAAVESFMKLDTLKELKKVAPTYIYYDKD